MMSVEREKAEIGSLLRILLILNEKPHTLDPKLTIEIL
jgi:hypothetical protein